MTVVTGGLITLEYAAAGVKYTSVGVAGNAARDADLTAYIQAATPVIEDIVGPVLQVSVTRKFDGGQSTIVLSDEVTSITSVTENGTAVTDFVFDPQSDIIYGGALNSPRYFVPGILAVEVTYVTGFATVPMTLQLATRELVRFWVQQGNQAQRPAYGDQVESTSFTPQGFAVPKRVIELCAPYRKMGGFA